MLSIRQFTFIISVIDIAVYTASLAYAGLNQDSGFLAPSNQALFDFGEKVKEACTDIIC